MNERELKNKLVTYFLMLFGLAVSVFVIMLLFNVSDYGITIASFGASVFMILSRNNLSKKKVFGAYILSTLIGYLFSRLSSLASLNVALATISAFITMTFFDFQHAPALGISMAMVLNQFNIWKSLTIGFCILFILGMAVVLKTVLQKPDKVLAMLNLDKRKIKWNF